ncbi:EF-hand domain-containing protein [Streptomyces sp. SBC-4]|nr:EF-hand domain-containing protein [Streptomyces sp. SBC-4]MDV5145430.1 EF-hand domain-containing protein [Streptomyces sp. SBC-4]
MTTAPTVRGRLTERFDLWDNDGNGILERSDFEAEARKVLHAFGEPESTPRGSVVVSTYVGLWNHIAEKAGSTRGVSREQFEEIGEDIIGQGAAGWAAVVRPHIAAVAQLCDTDGDGQISQAEFAKWLRAVGSESDPADAFKQIDTDNDGYLSLDELNAAVQAYAEGKLNVSLLG